MEPRPLLFSKIFWSPDSKRSFAVISSGRRKIIVDNLLTRRSVQLKRNLRLCKPGDALPIRRPVLFRVEEEQSYAFEFRTRTTTVWDVFVGTSINSFHLPLQPQRLGNTISWNTEGTLKALIDERNNTFIYYNAIYDYRMKNNNEILDF